MMRAASRWSVEGVARAAWWLALAALAAPGCFLERTPFEPSSAPTDAAMDAAHADAAAADGGPSDAGLEAGPPDSGPLDSGPPDSGPPDSGPPDSGPPDSGPPDSGPPDSGPPSCDSQYGSAVGYMLCDERPTECEFVSRLDLIRTCQSTCEALGGRCITAYRNEPWAPACARQGTAISCDTHHVDDICICSRGP